MVMGFFDLVKAETKALEPGNTVIVVFIPFSYLKSDESRTPKNSIHARLLIT